MFGIFFAILCALALWSLWRPRYYRGWGPGHGCGCGYGYQKGAQPGQVAQPGQQTEAPPANPGGATANA
jgi:hypothetical protein